MKIAIVAHGHLDQQLLPAIKSADYIVGVDRGAYWLLRHGVAPHVAIGDFDSTSPKERRHIRKKVRDVRAFPLEKDATDLELAINHAISLKPKEVIIYGAVGSRFDHACVAVNLLEKFLKQNIDAKIRDRYNEAFLLQSRRTILKSSNYAYLSILAYSSKTVVTLRGLLYPVTKRTFYRNTSLGVSNEIIGKEAGIIVHSGIVLVIQSRD